MKKLPSAFSVHAVLVFLLAFGAIGRGQSAPIATVALTQGWATFGEVVPQGLAFEALQVGSLPTQTDVKTRWPDGSIRFAIVTVHALTSGNYAIQPAAIGTGTFSPALPTASATLVIGGATYTAALPAAPSSDTWLSGPLAYEGRSIVAPVSAANGSPHPFLRVVFDTRVYNDGAARVDVTVENVLDLVGATTVTYNVTLTVNGNAFFTKAAVEHYYLTRWRKTFTVGGPLGDITPDLAPFNAANAIPPYLSLVRNQINLSLIH